MTLPWLPVVWIDISGSLLTLLLAALCLASSLRLLKTNKDQTFFNYLFLLTLSFVFFAVSRSFGHLIKQILLYTDRQHTWQHISPFSGSINTAAFIVIFSFGIYFHRSRKIYKELERHKLDLESLVAERTLKLEKSIREFSAVMDAIDYGVLFMDDQLKARIVNRAFREMWGIPDDFVAGQPSMRQLMEYNRYNNLYDVPDTEFEAYLDERETSAREGTIRPVHFMRKDGMILQYQCIVLPDGWRMLTYFDITELKNTQKKLIQSQKMEAIGLMAGGVAHDLNNILSGIVSYPDLLLMQLPENSELRRPLQVIQESGQRAAEVVADLLTVARGIASHRETRSLNTMIQQYLDSPEGLNMLSHFPEIQIQTDCTPEMTNISCSPVHIKKILMNLLTNAAESISGSGIIGIETTIVQKSRADQSIQDIESLKDGSYVMLRITDTGQGIAEKNIKHIFEPFYSKKVMGRSGTGLGLAIVWNTVQEHEGLVVVTSSSSGTIFTLYFPISNVSPESHRLKQDVKTMRGHGETILVVDDVQQQREIAAEMLSSLGYRIQTANSGEEAVALVKQQAFDLIILDMIMDPGINGRQTFEQILKIQPQQRAIITSGFSESEDIKKTERLGVRQIIRKPYTLEGIGLAVQKALS